jgi:hypothetical protein
MLINGRKIEGPNVEVLVLPRSDGDLVFKAQAVLNYDEFEKICPKPLPPMGKRPGEKEPRPLENDPGYVAAMRKYGEQKIQWMILKSLEATSGLVWESIDMSKPETWGNLESELQAAGINQIENSRILDAVMTANSLNQDKIDEARERFFDSERKALEGN